MPSTLGPRGSTIGAVLNAHRSVQPMYTPAQSGQVQLDLMEWLQRMALAGGLGVAPSSVHALSQPLPIDTLSWLQSMARARGLGIAPSQALHGPQGVASLGPSTIQKKH